MMVLFLNGFWARRTKKITIIGLGGWTVGRIEDDKVALSTIHKALDIGINFFDTAA